MRTHPVLAGVLTLGLALGASLLAATTAGADPNPPTPSYTEHSNTGSDDTETEDPENETPTPTPTSTPTPTPTPTSTGTPPPPASYVLAAWLVPGGPTSIWSPHQVLVDHVTTTTPSLNLLDASSALTCGTYYQFDLYRDDSATASLVAGGVLYGPGNPPEHLAYGVISGNPWKYLATPACAPAGPTPTETPTPTPTPTPSSTDTPAPTKTPPADDTQLVTLALSGPTWTFEVDGLDLNNVHPGDSFTLHGTGLPGGSNLHIELHSTPTVLGDVTVAQDGSFALTGTIPTDAPAGVHHLVATLSGPGIATTTVEKELTVVAASATTNGTAATTPKSATEGSSKGTEGENRGSGIAPNILTQGLNSIGDVVSNPAHVTVALAIGLVLLIFAVLPAHLLNATIAEQYERFARRIPALRSQPTWYVRLKAFLHKNPTVGGLLVTTATALLFGFADPKFGFTLASLRLFIAATVALFVVVYLANAIAGRIVSRTWSVNVAVNIRPLGLLLTLVGVIISRSLDFSPGFLIGLVLGLTIAGKSAAEHAWKAVLIRSSVVIGLALIAWIGFSAFPAGESDHATFWSELMLEILVAIATEGIVALLVELLPLHLLEGERLYKKSRVLWAAIYLAVVTIFIVAVVPWEGNWEALGSSLWSWITVVAGFGAVCVAIYLYFRFLATPLEEEAEEDGELVSIADNDVEQ